ncbi:golgin subfamily A member 6-like protein 22 isoform X2 [Syngnathoides biaculeatus]|uniref:golgin subfamily A member 6-like protein 22 isoform X2 n=1 Tax=Syngnathoides biaculeatus TaxID=300417 RepID=UPI002ADD3967|nr:golgin subfamily A member 6-like protein 22 isoform X2 [Syngnathoides biaculeatus]
MCRWCSVVRIPQLFSKWNYHWALMANGDQTKGETSDLQRVTSEEAEKNKPRIKFKIVPPPPPKPKSKPPPTPSQRASPQPLLIVRRKVEVDIFRLHWRESWMCLKPPKYLFLRASESKKRIQVFTAIDVSKNKYKPVGNASGPEYTSINDWNQSWKQVKGTTQSEWSEEKQFHWDILPKRALINYPEIGVYHLPVWAGTWKIMNFAFRQQKQKWDCDWPALQQSSNHKFDKVQQLLEQDEPRGWKDSWRLLKPTVHSDDCTVSELTFENMKINDVLLPGWNKSWLLSAPPLQEEETHEIIWSSCWLYRLQLRWCISSLQSHQKHSDLMTRRRNFLNSLLTSEMNAGNSDFTEWWDSWKTLKRWNPPGEEIVDDSEISESISDEEEEDKGVDSDDEEDELDSEEIEDEEYGGKDDEDQDEEVNEEEEMEDAEIEINDKDINVKTKTHNGENEQSDTDMSEEDEETENEREEADEEDEEMEEDTETHGMKLLNSHNSIQNEDDEEIENEDSGMIEDEKEEKVNEQYQGNNLNEMEVTEVHKLLGNKQIMEDEQLIVWNMGNGVDANEEKEDEEEEKEKEEEEEKVETDNQKCMEEHGKEVEEKQVYRNITLQLKEIFQMIANDKKDDEEESNDNVDTDKEEKIITLVEEKPTRETQSDRINRLDCTDEGEEDEEDVQGEEEEEEETEEEDTIEEENKRVKEEDDKNEKDGDEVEEKDVKQNIEEEEQDKMEHEKEAATDEEDKENQKEETGVKTDAEEDDEDEGVWGESHQWANNDTDKNNMKKRADGEWGEDSKEQTQHADEELQDAEEGEEVDADDVTQRVCFDDDAEGDEKEPEREECSEDDEEQLNEEEEDDVNDNEDSSPCKAPQNNELIVKAAHKTEEVMEDEIKDQKSRKPIKCKPSVPLHLQFHKLNNSFSSWKQSCTVAVAHRMSKEHNEDGDMEGEQNELQAWRESWRICRWRKPRDDEVLSFFTQHQRGKHKGLLRDDDLLLKRQWTLSWKMTKKGENMK